MARQKIKIVDNGSKAMRVLDALTPVNGTGAPTINAEYLGQIYIDETNHKVYVSKVVGSELPADDWATLDNLAPFTGEEAPPVNAKFVGQTYVDTLNKAVYISVATGSAAPADDWAHLVLL